MVLMLCDLKRKPMDLALFMRNRLKRLSLKPRNLARATRMTDSHIARLPKLCSVQTAPNRTDMHDQLERVLKLPQGHLAKLTAQRRRDFDA